jgi:hypothetical protein
LPEVKEAYLNLQQGWLQLAPELPVEIGQTVSVAPKLDESKPDPKSEQAK